MVTITKMLYIDHSVKAYLQRLYKECSMERSNKKRFTTLSSCKPLIIMVGTIGFEPTTSTVSR